MAGVDEIEAAVDVNPDRFFFGLEQVNFLMMSSGPLVEYLIDEMDNYLLSRLHNEYNEMIDEASERYGIKTKKQAEEVADDLKK